MNMERKLDVLAQDIYDWCKVNNLWGDNCMYFNGIALASWPTWAGEKGEPVLPELYLYRNKNPRDYFPGGESVFSMSFEGSLNHVLNAYVSGWVKLEEEFSKLFEKYGLHFEMYNSWNGNAYEI